jgi:hypothetical protein
MEEEQFYHSPQVFSQGRVVAGRFGNKGLGSG